MSNYRPTLTPSWLPPLEEAINRAITARTEYELLLTLTSYAPHQLLEATQSLLLQSHPEKVQLGLKILRQLPPDSPHLAEGTSLLEEFLNQTREPRSQAEAILTAAQLSPDLVRERLPYLQDAPRKIIQLSIASACRIIGSQWSYDHLLTLQTNTTGEVQDWCSLELKRLVTPTAGDSGPSITFPKPSADQNSIEKVVLRLAHCRSPFLWSYLLDTIESGTVTVPILEAATRLEDTRLYVPLWNLAWRWRGPRRPLNQALSACRWTDPKPVKQLFKEALNPTNLLISETSIGLLQRLGGQEVFNTAQAFCSARDPQRRLVGARVLGKIGGPDSPLRKKAITPLSEMLDHPNDDETLAFALEGIGDHKEEELTEAVARLLSHENPEVRKSVSVILYGTSPNPTDNMIALSTAREGMVRLAASQALEEILNPPAPEPAPAPGISETNPDLSPTVFSPANLNRYMDDPTNFTSVDEAPVDNSPLQLPPRVKRVLAVALVLSFGIALKSARRIIPEHTENPELVRVLTHKHLDKIARPTPQELLKARRPETKGLFANKRLLKLISMLRLPIESILVDKKECWYLYNRLPPQDASWVLSRAQAPLNDSPPGHELFGPLLELLHNEASSDNHQRVANLLRHVAPLNPALGSYLLEKLLVRLAGHQRDDLIVDFASVGTQLQSELRTGGRGVPHHPALEYILPQTRRLMIKELKSGWSDKHEKRLADHLEKLN